MKKPLILLLFITTLILAACGGAVEPTAEPALELQVSVVADDLVIGTPRVPFVLYDGPDQVADATAVAITLYDLSEATPAVAWTGSAVNYSDYEVPYWTVTPPVPSAGVWGLSADITLADGGRAAARFAIQVEKVPRYPNVGHTPPASENWTLADHDLAELTTDPQPAAALYETTIAAAMASGRPTVVMFATPAYCQTAFCAPVVETLKEVAAEYGDRVNFIQIEIFADYNENRLMPTVREWALESEPWTYVLDGRGVIAVRIGGPVSPRELTAALTAVLP